MDKRYRVLVKLKEGVLDVQGKAVESSIKELGGTPITSVRVGKVIEFSVADSAFKSGSNEEKEQIESYCRDLFSNPVIESFTWERL